jgi:hypothetical protein
MGACHSKSTRRCQTSAVRANSTNLLIMILPDNGNEPTSRKILAWQEEHSVEWN